MEGAGEVRGASRDSISCALPWANSSLQPFSDKSDSKLDVVEIKSVVHAFHTHAPLQHGAHELSQTGCVLVVLVCWEEPSG